MLRIEDIEDDVDFRPRRPAELRLYDLGVRGDGDRESRLLDPAEIAVVMRGRGW